MTAATPSAREWADRIDLDGLASWLAERRWYASKSRTIAGLQIDECTQLADSPPQLLALLQVRFPPGDHELYQLPLTLVAPELATDDAAASARDLVAVDGLEHGDAAHALLAAIESERTIQGEEGEFTFRRSPAGRALPASAPARPAGPEQSHTSLVFGDRTVLKVLRRLEPGVSPELELLRFLGEREFPNVPALEGFYEYEGRQFTCTLGIAQQYVKGAVGGFSLALEWATARPTGLVSTLRDLGAVTARLHNCLASETVDPAFTAEEPSNESLALLAATIDEDVERIFTRLPDDERLAPIAGRGQDVRDRISARGHAGPGGRAIRIHGDYHLGQTLRADGEWQIIDFEGEPSRPLHERRQKRSPLRDVASMLRSFAYVVATASASGATVSEDLEERAREAFLEGYLETVDRGLLPNGEAQIANLLAIYELEKAVYELRYELDHRPDWLPIPVGGIVRLLEVV